MKTQLRVLLGTVPADASEGVQEWMRNKTAMDSQNNRDIEDEFGRTGKVALWTPALTFATPGNLAVSYSVQKGDLIRTKAGVTASFFIVTGSYSWTTASGALQITGLPYPGSTMAADAGMRWVGPMNFGGITKTGYTSFVPTVTAGSSTIQVVASGSGVANVFLAASDMPSGGTIILNGTISFRIRS